MEITERQRRINLARHLDILANYYRDTIEQDILNLPYSEIRGVIAVAHTVSRQLNAEFGD